MKLVRIHPIDRPRGFRVRNYIYRGQKFSVDSGWYKVSDEFAADLATLKAQPSNPDSKLVFEVGTEDEAKAIAMEHYAKQNPEVQVERAVSGAQTVDETKLEADPNESKSDGDGDDGGNGGSAANGDGGLDATFG